MGEQETSIYSVEQWVVVVMATLPQLLVLLAVFGLDGLVGWGLVLTFMRDLSDAGNDAFQQEVKEHRSAFAVVMALLVALLSFMVRGTLAASVATMISG